MGFACFPVVLECQNTVAKSEIQIPETGKTSKKTNRKKTCVCVYVCACVSMCVRVCVYLSVCAHIHRATHMEREKAGK